MCNFRRPMFVVTMTSNFTVIYKVWKSVKNPSKVWPGWRPSVGNRCGQNDLNNLWFFYSKIIKNKFMWILMVLTTKKHSSSGPLSGGVKLGGQFWGSFGPLKFVGNASLTEFRKVKIIIFWTFLIFSTRVASDGSTPADLAAKGASWRPKP